MGQKVSPIGLRVGIIRDWDAKWYASKDDLPKFLHQDIKIRDIIMANTRVWKVSRVEIKRTSSKVEVNIFSAAPGLILGENGKGIEALLRKIRGAIGKKNAELIKINVVEIKNPALEAQLVANDIAEKLENRASFRTVQKMTIRNTLKAGAKGIKTNCSGRLGGVDMARDEGYTEGVVPLSTLRNDIDYATANAHTTYGVIGVKVWISRGEILKKRNKGGK